MKKINPISDLMKMEQQINHQLNTESMTDEKRLHLLLQQRDLLNQIETALDDFEIIQALESETVLKQYLSQ